MDAHKEEWKGEDRMEGEEVEGRRQKATKEVRKEGALFFLQHCFYNNFCITFFSKTFYVYNGIFYNGLFYNYFLIRNFF